MRQSIWNLLWYISFLRNPDYFWNLCGTLPIILNLEYKMNKTVHEGFSLNLLTNGYRVGNKDFLWVDDYNAYSSLILTWWKIRSSVLKQDTHYSVSTAWELWNSESRITCMTWMYRTGISLDWHIISGYVQTYNNTQLEEKNERSLRKSGFFYGANIPIELIY